MADQRTETPVRLARPTEGKVLKQAALSPLRFWLLAMLIGLVGGCGAFIFRGMIAFVHNLLFLGKISFFYESNVHTPPSPWGPLIIFVPVIGGMGVTWLVHTFAPEARGHGVPEVMDAIYYNKSVIRPVVALIKSLASALSIGSGGSVGREGPIIQIGSAFGSSIGQWLRIPAWQRTTLIAAGAGAGIAATFNTPIGGVLFAAELLLHEISVWTLVPVVIATASASYVGRFFFGPNPAFAIPELRISYFHLTHPILLLAYMGLGLLIGLVSVVYIRSIYAFEDFFDAKIRNPYLRHGTGMLLLGILMYVVLLQTGAYHIEGVGYATIQQVLSEHAHFFLAALTPFRAKTIRHFAHPRLWRIRRRLFSRTFSRRDLGQRLWNFAPAHFSRHHDQPGRVRSSRNGRDRWRRHRRGHHRNRHDFRDDPRLRSHRPDDNHGRDCLRGAENDFQ